MSWKDKRALDRIFNVFKRNKEKIFKEDIEALKQLNESIENQNAILTNDHLLFAKLLAYVLRLNLDHYKDMSLAIKKTSDVLNNSLLFNIEMLKMTLNNVDNIKFFESEGIDVASFKNQDAIISNKQKEISDKLLKSWTYENVEKSFYRTANDFIKDIDNYGL